MARLVAIGTVNDRQPRCCNARKRQLATAEAALPRPQLCSTYEQMFSIYAPRSPLRWIIILIRAGATIMALIFRRVGYSLIGAIASPSLRLLAEHKSDRRRFLRGFITFSCHARTLAYLSCLPCPSILPSSVSFFFFELLANSSRRLGVGSKGRRRGGREKWRVHGLRARLIASIT